MSSSLVESLPLHSTCVRTSGALDQTEDTLFVEVDGETFMCIYDVGQMPTFFFTIVSSFDHWLFISSNGSLTAGRGSPDTALFPYYTVDKIIDNWNSTGPQTVILSGDARWEPFKSYSLRQYDASQRLLKSVNADTVIFEETNHSLGLRFSYQWSTSAQYGFVRQSKLENLSGEDCRLRVVDGLTNFLPAAINSRTQLQYSCLGDAYKLSELDRDSSLLVHRMASGLTDQAVPMECLVSTTLWSYGLEKDSILIRADDVEMYLENPGWASPLSVRGFRGSYFNAADLCLAPGGICEWAQVASINQSQANVAGISQALRDKEALWLAVLNDIEQGKAKLDALLMSSDALQVSSDLAATTHHRANVLYNVMRGGVFADAYRIEKQALLKYIRCHHKQLSRKEEQWLFNLPENFLRDEMLEEVVALDSPVMLRLCREYLPLTFSRRHGDPSRPWNRFHIRTHDEEGQAVIGYQGNWRDIFQNWEALVWSFPQYINACIQKFLNASTADGYNPYRITSEGIEWEKLEPDDPWSSIGYWGDHQIVYLLNLLEIAQKMTSGGIRNQLAEEGYVFADVPYVIKDFNNIVRDPKHSIQFDSKRDELIEERVLDEGADGRLLRNDRGKILTATMLEKLLIPMAVKLSNLVPGGGIWLNTQRPEWNDANNALAGNGLSVVTCCYLYRYLNFIKSILEDQDTSYQCHENLQTFLDALSLVLMEDPQAMDRSPESLFSGMERLGRAGENYRARVYQCEPGERVAVSSASILTLIHSAKKQLKYTIEKNRRDDGMYHSYNVLDIDPKSEVACVRHLGLMLEGQVAALCSDALSLAECEKILEALAHSSLYCPERKSYMLYPDRDLPSFLDYNRVPVSSIEAIPLLKSLTENGDTSIIVYSANEQCYRFSISIENRFSLERLLDALADSPEWKALVSSDREAVLQLHESTFNHLAFTGRSSTMFAYEGLGSIYWHMVSKLMLATAKLAVTAAEDESDAFEGLRARYYQIQAGLGFRKSAKDYGAFPIDAYSHTPSHAGAQQPGLTGMVKEGLLCRLEELGVHLEGGKLRFCPRLLRATEFTTKPVSHCVRLCDGREITIDLPMNALLFTLCQTPVIYELSEVGEGVRIDVFLSDGSRKQMSTGILPYELTRELFCRTGYVERIIVHLSPDTHPNA